MKKKSRDTGRREKRTGAGPRERSVGLREDAAEVREKDLGAREATARTREAAARMRETAVAHREELARLREEVLRAKGEAEGARSERERLLALMREANENLVLASMQAQELADAAEVAHGEVVASEERFRSLVTASSAIVFQAGAVGHIRIDPEMWRAVTGLDVDPEGEPQGWGWLRAVHPDDRGRVREAWTRAVAMREVYTEQHRLRRADGTYATVAARGVPVPRGGPVREWIGMMTDVSDRVRIEEARERFIAILGHDLRNPLGAILMTAEALLRGSLREPDAGAMERIARSARRMDAMIHDLLDFARGRLGPGIPIKRETCDLGRICADEVNEMTQSHPDRVITAEVIGDVTGEWDRDRLQQVLSNLIGNALQHGADPIAVAAREEGDDVILSVHNEGPPIPAAVMPTIFEPFRRGAGDRAEGLGLGLFIVSEVVRAHGGTISVRSSQREGTTITIRLPRHAPAAGRESSPPLHADGPLPDPHGS